MIGPLLAAHSTWGVGSYHERLSSPTPPPPPPPPPPPECQAAFWRIVQMIENKGLLLSSSRPARQVPRPWPAGRRKNGCGRYRPRWAADWPETGRTARAAAAPRCGPGARRDATLPPTRRGLAPIVLRGVQLGEAAPPPGEEAVQWHLLTNLPVEAAAAKIVRHSWQRWRIEACFRVLGARCRVRQLASRPAELLFTDFELSFLAPTPGGSGCPGPTE